MAQLGLRLTRRGHLQLDVSEDAPSLDDKTATRLTDAFARGSGHGLLQLGAVLPAVRTRAYLGAE